MSRVFARLSARCLSRGRLPACALVLLAFVALPTIGGAKPAPTGGESKDQWGHAVGRRQPDQERFSVTVWDLVTARAESLRSLPRCPNHAHPNTRDKSLNSYSSQGK